MRGGTVWVVHPVREDLSSALRFGQLNFINRGYIYPDQLVGRSGDEFPPGVVELFRSCTANFDPDVDFLVMIGDQAQLLTFSSMLVRKHQSFRALRFDRQASGYVPIVIPGLWARV